MRIECQDFSVARGAGAWGRAARDANRRDGERETGDGLPSGAGACEY
ncbi:MAG TPA: hypothetical protein VF703_11895 [Pyrinomonadaceae bacterium]